MRKLLLSSAVLLALAACNTDKNAESVTSDKANQINPSSSTKITQTDKKNLVPMDEDELEAKQSAFSKAVLWGNADNVEELLKQGENPSQNVQSISCQGTSNCKFVDIPALCGAIRGCGLSNPKERERVVNLLIQAGADVNKQCGNVYGLGESSPLILATDMGGCSPVVVNSLITAGADTNGRGRNGETALMAASYRGNIEIVQTLLQAGADVNATDNKGNNAFTAASDNSQVQIIKLLLDAGIKVSQDDKNEAFILACRYAEADEVKTLLASGADINSKDKKGNSALMYASQYGNAEIVKLLLDSGLKVSQEDKDEALRLACPEANIEVVEVLLSAGANVNSKDKNGKTALMYTTPYGYYEENMSRKVMEKLIAEGADVNTTDNDGGTALMAVVSDFTDGEEGERDRLELIDTLITAGANVNAADNKGKTALMYIILDGYNDFSGIATKLLKTGANVNATDIHGRTVLMDFVNKVDEKEASLSDEEGPAGSLEYPTTKEILEGLKVLLKAGADVNAKDKDGHTALDMAQKAGNTKIVELLKQAGAKK